jgi:mono/diheme cytochrome c family protein
VRSVVSGCAGLYRLALVRRVAPIAILLVLLALAGAGCSDSKPGEKIVSPLPTKVVGTVPKATPVSTAVPAQYKNGDPAAGKAVFTSAGCVGCHTLAAANSHGTVGPNLDQAKPPLSLAVARVTEGKNAMPPFKAQLTAKQIADVTAFVVKSSGGNLNG